MLVDTDVIIWYLRGEKKAVDLIDHMRSFALSAVSYMEILHGLRNKIELRQWKAYVKARGIQILLVDQDVTARAIFWTEEYALSHRIRLADALIGATANVHGLELLTGNDADYRFLPGLSIKVFKV